jgi:hypothetical protein
MADAPEEERWRFVEQPVPSATNPESTLSAIASPPPELTLARDANVLASDVEAIAALAMTRVKETLSSSIRPTRTMWRCSSSQRASTARP